VARGAQCRWDAAVGSTNHALLEKEIMTSVVSTHAQAQGTTNIVALRHQMRTALVPWVQFAEPEWARFTSLFHIRIVQDREHILLPGASVDDLVFVCDGLLRAYYLSDNGAESNKAFIAEHEFAGPLPATAVDASVMCGIQALEATTLLVARYTDFVTLLELHPAFGQFQRQLTAWLLSRKEVRMRSLLQGDARKLYLDFVERYPDLARRVPQYHIASYLGITEVHLSRLRRTLANEFAS
jgi:CRP-like cAMP-binding protein